MAVKPFVKWAGGKSQLLPSIRQIYPPLLGQTIRKYCEPFVGGGAVLFDVLSNYKIDEILINDINSELINTYIYIKNHLNELIVELSKMQDIFWQLDIGKRQEYYYKKRERFNYLKNSSDKTTNIEKAALFIFLNKTCFNGLFRVNKKGLFNVPIGAYKQPLICDTENLIATSHLLQKVIITCGDYKKCGEFIDENTFVYIDPPYRPLTPTANFTSYSERDFNDEEQKELRVFVDDITGNNAKVVISNSDPKNNSNEDVFFDNLYNKYNILRVPAKRMINSNSQNRGYISELLISNY